MRDGVTVKVPISTGSHISKLVKAILIAEPFDLPARCLVSGTVQFNGKQCCIKCLQTGESCTAAKGGYIWVYPFNNENPKWPLRDNESFKQLASEAYHENKLVFGVKYPTWLHDLKYYGLVNGVATDYMHRVMLSVLKTLLKLWFASEHKKDLVFTIVNIIWWMPCRYQTNKLW